MARHIQVHTETWTDTQVFLLPRCLPIFVGELVDIGYHNQPTVMESIQGLGEVASVWLNQIATPTVMEDLYKHKHFLPEDFDWRTDDFWTVQTTHDI